MATELFDILSRAAAKLLNQTVVTVSATPVPLPLHAVVMEAGGMTVNSSTATFTLPKPGDYRLSMSFNGDWSNSDDLEFAIWVNGTQVGSMLSQNGRGGRHMSVSYEAILDNMAANDTVQVQMLDADGATFDVTAVSCQLNCAFIGPHV